MLSCTLICNHAVCGKPASRVYMDREGVCEECFLRMAENLGFESANVHFPKVALVVPHILSWHQRLMRDE